MPHEMVIKETAEWLKKAAIDLRSCRIGLAAEPPALADEVFKMIISKLPPEVNLAVNDKNRIR